MIDAGVVTRESQDLWFNSLSTRSDYKIWGVSFHGQPIGVGGLKIQNDNAVEYFGYIGEKNFRGKGIGAAMLLLLEEKAKELNAEKIILKVLSFNNNAIRLYKKSDYRIYKKDDKFIYMYKKIK